MLLVTDGLGRISSDDDERETASGGAQAGGTARRAPGTPGSADEFDLYYVRAGRKSTHPLVVIPGGPGVALLQVYQGYAAARRTSGST